ncbi:MAG: type IV pilus biogenesis/stability protein PilW [Massilia sp.]
MKPGLGRLLRCALAVALLALGAGCAGVKGDSTDLKTASDETAADKRAAIRLQLAVNYYREGQLTVALDEVKQAIAAAPDSAEAYGVRALIYAKMGEQGLAEESFQRALKLAPRNPDLSNNYGSYLCQQGHGAQAMPYFEMARKSALNQSPLNALLNAGSCSLKNKQYDAAERYLLDALRYDADHPTTNASLARVYFERRDYQRAGFFINRLQATAKPGTLPPDVMWLAIRIDRKLGDRDAETSMVTQLRRYHPASAEFAAFQRGAFDE